MIYDIQPNQIFLGPIMEPERMFIRAICNLIDPKEIVEFGFLQGESSKVILDSIDKDAHVTSYDHTVERYELKDARHTLVAKDMKEYENTTGKKIDMVFFDASHFLSDSLPAWERVKAHLTDEAIIIVHDTGAYKEALYNPKELDYIKKIKNGYVYHCPDEHDFLKLLHKEGYNCVNFTATSKVRHGIAVLQKVFDFESTRGK